jgi:hypothetical protein
VPVRLSDFPLLVFAISLAALWGCAWLGMVAADWRGAERGEREDFDLVLAATLTLLGLIIGFTFSMAISRYDLRKGNEEAEANAIGTEYLRVDLLPAEQTAKLRELLGDYLQQRILFYTVNAPEPLRKINAQTNALQGQLWSIVRASAKDQPNVLSALAVSGMNDVLNAAGYTQAAWTNRIPREAWVLMVLISVLSNLMIGYAASRMKKRVVFLVVMPLVLAIAFFLIADIDSPRGGYIHIKPLNLLSLTSLFRPP